MGNTRHRSAGVQKSRCLKGDRHMAKIALVGLGTMGPGIAATFLRAGDQVAAYDVSEAQRTNAVAAIEAALLVLQRLETPEQGGGSIEICNSLEACVKDADFVLENVPEKIELKTAVLREIDALISDSTIVASDTSGIPITQLQAAMSSPARVVGMHWSNPPHVIPMIEVVAGLETSKETVEWMVATVLRLNMIPIRVHKDVPGFVENRILYAVMREAIDLVEQGVIGPEDLDRCVSWGIGYKLAVVGPMALLDMAGLDIYQSVGSYLNKSLCAKEGVSPFITQKVSHGRLGLKSGGGIFDYTPSQLSQLRTERIGKFINVRKVLEA
jgi:5-formyl-3-hydroxy-2-methylpyridine 4-carboxylate dehydrogenase